MPKSFNFSQYQNIIIVSPSFIEFYNEAFHIEQLGYKNIAGPGYRKVIEFLIKDYIIKLKIATKNEIKDMFIGNCIDKYISDEKISELSKRAFWLGNDQTHYYQKWREKDIDDLKNVIKLLLNYLENNLEYRQIIKEIKK